METKKERRSSIEDLLREKEKIEQSITEQFNEYVTILFTDIAGYTRYVETHGDLAAKSLLYRHNEIVFGCVEAHEGRVVKTIGDAVMAAFQSPLHAVRASVATQQALALHNETASAQKQIRIRIGLNTGNAIKDQEDYFGDAVNVAARIESAGEAGQVLVSQSVYDAVKEDPEILIRHHGQKAVKGKREPLELYRVFLSREELERAEKEAQKKRAAQENRTHDENKGEHGDTERPDADFASHWKGGDGEAAFEHNDRKESGSRSQMPMESAFEAVSSEEEKRLTLPRSTHRFDLIWKFSLPIMICLGIFIYLYPQFAPSEKSATLLNQYIQAFNLLRSGEVDEAKNIFLGFGEKDPKCQEGLAAIAYQKSAYDKAKEFCDRSIAADGTLFYPRVIKGNIFFDNGETEQAREVYTEALNYSPALKWQAGELYFRLGRLSSMESDPEKALQYYDKAMDLDRANADIVTARGVVLEKMGELDKALGSYDAALKIDPDHPMANTFYRQIKQNMAAAEDKERQARVDALVSDLVAAMEKKKRQAAAGESEKSENDAYPGLDSWTSRPVTLFIANRERSGSLSLREGEDQFFELALLDALAEGGKISIVDRALLDKLLSELKLGSSALSDPATALQLGRLVSARLIGNLKFLGYAGETKIFLKLIETETSSVKVNLSGSAGREIPPDVLAQQFANEIMEKVPAAFPIRGRIAEMEGRSVLINIGSTQGVETGMVMRVFPAEAVTNSMKRKTVGAVKVTEVMPDACRGEIVKGEDVVDATHVVEAFSS